MANFITKSGSVTLASVQFTQLNRKCHQSIIKKIKKFMKIDQRNVIHPRHAHTNQTNKRNLLFMTSIDHQWSFFLFFRFNVIVVVGSTSIKYRHGIIIFMEIWSCELFTFKASKEREFHNEAFLMKSVKFTLFDS